MRTNINAKRKNYRKSYISLIIIVIGLILSYFTYYNRVNIESFFRDILYYPIAKLGDDSDVLGEVFDEELRSENKELMKLLEIEGSISEFEYINATVITRNTSYFLAFFTINKGSNNGISKGMAVITSGGLIGIIDSVSRDSSVVKMITDSDSRNKVSVKIISNDNVTTTIMAMNEEAKMVAYGINKNSDIKIGDKVITSGLSDIFPSGILIGYVESIVDDNYKISKNVYVKLSSNVDNIRYVAVLKRGIHD